MTITAPSPSAHDRSAHNRSAETSAPILDVLTERWSPRSFDTEHELPAGALASVFEAARWSPSANNSQPWRYIVGRRGSETFEKIHANLVGFNAGWAGSAAALVVAVAEVTDADGKDRPWAVYDLGQSVAHLSVQAHAEGLHVHQMAGIDKDGLRAAFGLDERFAPVVVVAIGAVGAPEALGVEALIERETAPRTRLGLDEIVLVRE